MTNLTVGDKVTHVAGSAAKGTVKAIHEDAVVVTWILGSGWPHTVWHTAEELQKEILTRCGVCGEVNCQEECE